MKVTTAKVPMRAAELKTGDRVLSGTNLADPFTVIRPLKPKDPMLVRVVVRLGSAAEPFQTELRLHRALLVVVERIELGG